MKYKEFNGPVEELVGMKLKEIEEKENVRILHAVESGSRAWGFASPDSDYDVRFIYVRPLEYYLRLEAKPDFMDWELDETLDMNGWDLSKALQHFHKSNATLFEWVNSPVEMVKYKKYFYVLRPLLACKWIEKKACPPPVLFQTLAEEVLEDSMKDTVQDLVRKKTAMVEAEKGKRIDRLNDYIEDWLPYFKEKSEAMADDRKKDWRKLNEIFAEYASGLCFRPCPAAATGCGSGGITDYQGGA